MATTRLSRAYDPEFDRPGGVSLGRRVFDLPHHYQRLVANPFLALLGLCVWFASLRGVMAMKASDARTLLFIAIYAGILLVWRLPQYHCLDCGGTGRLPHWREHECEVVKLRRAMGSPRRFRGPTPGVQMLLWFYTAIVCGVFVYIVRR